MPCCHRKSPRPLTSGGDSLGDGRRIYEGFLAQTRDRLHLGEGPHRLAPAQGRVPAQKPERSDPRESRDSTLIW
jgi:hypothetical protein